MAIDMKGLSAAVAQVKTQSSAAIGSIADGKKEKYNKLDKLHYEKNFPAAVKDVGDTILGTVNLGAELTNTGVAALTNPIAAAMPAFAAAQLGSLYLGIPHAHLHPPSLVPPVPTPVPLPTMGAITLGTSVQVLVGGLPAARCGDLGMAPTCGGFAPFFTVFLGSSKVFIGGTRAARQSDMCTACTPSTAGAARLVAKALAVASKATAIAGIAASVVDAHNADAEADKAETQADATEQAAVSTANLIGAAAASAQMAADSAATALSATMGTDPALPPGMIGFVTTGAANVLIGGVPMPNIPDPAHWILGKLSGKVKLKWAKLKAKRAGGKGGCKS
jgi:uncharacterized Zn-binding protein involved in type VI secretion